MEEQSKAVQVFNFQGKQEIRTTVIDGEPWFSAIDVCKTLGIANHRDALSRLPEKWKWGVGNTDPLQMSLQVTLIKEPALYKLAFQSRKPEAEAFTEWVAEEVLPSIRKTGAYVAPGVQLPQAGEQLLLPERVTDEQAVALLGQLETLVKEEQLAPSLRSTARYTLEFALKKAQAGFHERTLHSVNFKEKPNKWGMIRAKEYPDETAKEREDYHREIMYRHVQEEYARLKEYLAQVEQELLDLKVIQHHFFTELQAALKDMDQVRIQQSLQKIERWLEHMKTPDASAAKLLIAIQEKLVVLLRKHTDGLGMSALLRQCRLSKDDVEPVLEDLVSKNVVRLDQRKEARRTKRTYKVVKQGRAS